MIFHLPHSSFHIPSDLRSTLLLEDQELEAELRVMTDAFTDDLIGSHSTDTDMVVTFPVSRLVVDPERFLDDAQEEMSKIGMGVIYQRTSSAGEPLKQGLVDPAHVPYR